MMPVKMDCTTFYIRISEKVRLLPQHIVSAFVKHNKNRMIEFIVDTPWQDINTIVRFLQPAVITKVEINSYFKPSNRDQYGNHMKKLSEFLMDDKTVRSLKIYDEEYGLSNCASYFAYLLCINRTITTFCLYCNNSTVEDIRQFSEALRINNVLKELILTENSITEEKATIIASALKVNTSLKTLNLIGNKIQDNGTNAICFALLCNNSLQNLWIGENSITAKGCVYMANLLLKNRTLKCIILSNNMIIQEGVLTIDKSIIENNVISKIDMTNNKGIITSKRIDSRILL